MLGSTHRYRTVTFDMGSTLVELRGGYDRHLLSLAQRAGLELDLAAVRLALREAWDGQLERDAHETWEPSVDADAANTYEIDRRICLHLGITDAEMHREANRLSRQYFHDIATYRVYPDVWTTLQALRDRGLTLGIVSNWDWHLPDLCQQLELASHFDFIVTSARVGASKPHPAIFREALRLAQCEPAEVMHVGDNLHADVHGARGCGITGVLLDRNGQAAPAAFPVVQSLEEMVALI